ncbi:helix-turn-helix domain-containing protein [Psychrobacter aquimaris]|uniref:helix-turn-helix domain-containing protein n=1 Tax=Psychrobacter aquimaris TaxID=292733 RepID=UPI003FD64A3D
MLLIVCRLIVHIFNTLQLMKSINQTFGLQVKRYRKKKGISQEELASISGLHRTYIGSIERGERNVSLNNVEKIAISLGVVVIDLLKNEEPT